MSFLDKIFNNPQPRRVVNGTLYRLYMCQAVAEAQQEAWSEETLAERIQSFPDYLRFLNGLNNAVVQEISDVDQQLYGPLQDDK